MFKYIGILILFFSQWAWSASFRDPEFTDMDFAVQHFCQMQENPEVCEIKLSAPEFLSFIDKFFYLKQSEIIKTRDPEFTDMDFTVQHFCQMQENPEVCEIKLSAPEFLSFIDKFFYLKQSEIIKTSVLHPCYVRVPLFSYRIKSSTALDSQEVCQNRNLEAMPGRLYNCRYFLERKENMLVVLHLSEEACPDWANFMELN